MLSFSGQPELAQSCGCAIFLLVLLRDVAGTTLQPAWAASLSDARTTGQWNIMPFDPIPRDLLSPCAFLIAHCQELPTCARALPAGRGPHVTGSPQLKFRQQIFNCATGWEDGTLCALAYCSFVMWFAVAPTMCEHDNQPVCFEDYIEQGQHKLARQLLNAATLQHGTNRLVAAAKENGHRHGAAGGKAETKNTVRKDPPTYIYSEVVAFESLHKRTTSHSTCRPSKPRPYEGLEPQKRGTQTWCWLPTTQTPASCRRTRR